MDITEATESIFLCGCGVDDALVKNMAERLFLTSQSDWNHASACLEETSAKPLALITNVDASCLAHAAERFPCSYFEISELNDDPDARLLDWVAEAGVIWSLTTRTAYHMPVAYHICKGLAKHAGIKREAIELALHEAISNAAIHGNLAMDRAPENTIQGIVEFYRMAEERLSDPQYACRRVEIMVRWQEELIQLRVIDQGRGSNLKRGKSEAAPWKGMSLISSLADSVVTGGEGNDLTMRFKR